MGEKQQPDVFCIFHSFFFFDMHICQETCTLPLADKFFYFNSIHHIIKKVLHLGIEIEILSFPFKGEKQQS